MIKEQLYKKYLCDICQVEILEAELVKLVLFDATIETSYCTNLRVESAANKEYHLHSGCYEEFTKSLKFTARITGITFRADVSICNIDHCGTLYTSSDRREILEIGNKQ